MKKPHRIVSAALALAFLASTVHAAPAYTGGARSGPTITFPTALSTSPASAFHTNAAQGVPAKIINVTAPGSAPNGTPLAGLTAGSNVTQGVANQNTANLQAIIDANKYIITGKPNGDDGTRAAILYFPNGTYEFGTGGVDVVGRGCLFSVSNEDSNERSLKFIGQSQANTILKLQNSQPPFTSTTAGYRFIQFLKDTTGNQQFGNEVRNLTIEIGTGNPAAAALDFHNNNNGGVSFVTIRQATGTSDADTPRQGLRLDSYASGISLVSDVTVQGFRVGILTGSLYAHATLEHITLDNQRDAGLRNSDKTLTVRDLRATNQRGVAVQSDFTAQQASPLYTEVPAGSIRADFGHLVLLDSELSRAAGNTATAAIDVNGFLFVRDTKCNGYTNLITANGIIVAGTDLTGLEFNSEGAPYRGWADAGLNSPRLPIEEAPDFNDWAANATDWVLFQGSGNPAVDDTVPLRNALASAVANNKKFVGILPTANGKIYLSDQIDVDVSRIRRIVFFNPKFNNSGNLISSAANPKPVFRLIKNSGTNTFFTFDGYEDARFGSNEQSGAHCVIENAAPGIDIVVRGVQSNFSNLFYRVAASNTSPGKLFMENPMIVNYEVSMAPNSTFPGSRAFALQAGQQAWLRAFNPEDGVEATLNNGGTMVVLGYKSEGFSASFESAAGGRTEVLGGLDNGVKPRQTPEHDFFHKISGDAEVFHISSERVGGQTQAAGDANRRTRIIAETRAKTGGNFSYELRDRSTASPGPGDLPTRFDLEPSRSVDKQLRSSVMPAYSSVGFTKERVGGGNSPAPTLTKLMDTSNDRINYDLTGRGAGVAASGTSGSDDVSFAHYRVQGNFELTAVVVFDDISGAVSPNARAGLMLRAFTAAGAQSDTGRSAFINIDKSRNMRFAYRDQPAGTMTIGSLTANNTGTWFVLRLARVGNTIYTSFRNINTAAWTPLDQRVFSSTLPAALSVGLAMSTASTTSTAGISFNDVRIAALDGSAAAVNGTGGVISPGIEDH